MLHIGDQVLYRSNGICTVQEKSRQEMPGNTEKGGCECYVLRPMRDPSVKIFIQTENEALLRQIRPLWTAEEMLALLNKVPELSMKWNEDMRARTAIFRDLIAEGDREHLAAMIKLLYEKQQKLRKAGKKLYAADENMLKKAEGLLFEEAAYVMEMNEADIAHLFRSRIPACAEDLE